MSLDLAAVPLALMAGVVGVLSPCVWPLVPVVTSAAAGSGRTGPDPEIFRHFAAFLLVMLGAVLLVPRFGNWVSLKLSMLSGRMGIGPGNEAVSAPGQFGVGALLGFVWLPCVGPTLGAAVALAALGQNMAMAFVVRTASVQLACFWQRVKSRARCSHAGVPAFWRAASSAKGCSAGRC